MRLCLFLCAALIVVPSLAAQTAWKLVWSDEFNGPADSQPDSSKWAYDLGGNGWGNAELETYTSAAENAHVDGSGNLVIRAIRSPSGSYTSARLKTQGKVSWTYGRIEARMKLPYGQGIWPAFWMLGSDIPTVPWPACGEIDIMENIGKEPSIVHGTAHGPGYSGGSGIGGAYTLPGDKRFADDFHVFSVVWSAESLEFFVDSVSYEKVTPASLPPGRQWVFNKPFFLLLNVAVGGSWPGYPDASSSFPQEMTVDYVRVYQAVTGPEISAGGIVNAASFGYALSPGSLAGLFGAGLAQSAITDVFDTASWMFPRSAGTTAVAMNGVACALTYVSPEQINFQVPWETPVGTPVPVQVVRDGTPSNTILVTLAATAPSAFSVSGVSILTCPGGEPRPGAACTLWGNGFGAKTVAQQNGVPSGLSPLPRTTSACKLVVEGVDATISYCGAAPGQVIDQLNFGYPTRVPDTGTVLRATLAVGEGSGELLLPLAR